MAYPLGWSVIPQMLVRRERWPGGSHIKGVPLVYAGQQVQPDTPTIRLQKSDLPPSTTENTRPTGGMDIGGASIASHEAVWQGAPGYEMLIAGLRGRVVNITRRGGVVIESRAAIIQGVLGAGRQVAGVLTMWSVGALQNRQHIPHSAILVVPGPLNSAMLLQAMNSGVVGVVASSISSRDLEDFLHTNLVELMNSVDVDRAQNHLPPITLLFTEGLGTIAMPARTINLLSQHLGSIALLSGATSVQQSIFPELVISLSSQETQHWQPVQPDPTLAIGAQVRICGGNYEGAIGEINYLFTHQQLFPSGVRAHAARLRLEDGSMLVVPLALLERIG